MQQLDLLDERHGKLEPGFYTVKVSALVNRPLVEDFGLTEVEFEREVAVMEVGADKRE